MPFIPGAHGGTLVKYGTRCPFFLYEACLKTAPCYKAFVMLVIFLISQLVVGEASVGFTLYTHFLCCIVAIEVSECMYCNVESIVELMREGGCTHQEMVVFLLKR